MLEDAGLRPGQPIVLACCDAGRDGGAADRLAALLSRSTVIAADTAVWDDRDGGLFPARETVVNGMPRPHLVADDNGAYHPDGSWKAHRAGAEPVPLSESDPRHPAVPVQLDPAVDYAQLLRGEREAGYTGEVFGSRVPESALAQITDAFARRDPAAVITAEPPHAGQWMLGELDPTRTPPDIRQDPLNEGLRKYADGLLDKALRNLDYKPFTEDRVRQQARERKINDLEDDVSKAAEKFSDAEAKEKELQSIADEQRKQGLVLSDDANRKASLERNNARQLREKAKDDLTSCERKLRNEVERPNLKVKLRLELHSIPVDGNWDQQWVDFHDEEGGDYPSILNRLKALRDDHLNNIPDFEERYARAMLDLAASKPGIPQSLRDLAGALYGQEKVSDFLNDPDPRKWNARENEIGTFLHDTAALTVLQVFVEGHRNGTALVTNLANWHMVEQGMLRFDDALGYLNVMGAVGSVRVGQVSSGMSDPEGLELSQRVAEMEMRQRQILALYAVATSKVAVAEDATGVAALNAYFAREPDAARGIEGMMSELVTRLGWEP